MQLFKNCNNAKCTKLDSAIAICQGHLFFLQFANFKKMTVNYCSYYFRMFSVIMPWSNQLAFRKYAVCTCLVINHNSKKLLEKTMVQISKRLVNQKKKFYKILCMNLFYCPLTSYYAAYFVSYSSLVRPRPNLQKNRVWGFRFWNLFKWVNEDGFFGFLMYFFFIFNDCF